MGRIHQYLIPLLSVAYVFFHMAFYDTLEFHRDELLYLALGDHPAFGYASVPPMIGWVAFLLNNLTGYSLIMVKLTSALIGGGVIFFSGKISEEFGGGDYAVVITGTAIAISTVFLRVFHLFQPVPFDVFLWTISFYLYLRFVNTKDTKFLFYLAVTIGVGIMTKYLIFLLAVLLFLTLVIRRKHYMLTGSVFVRLVGITLLVASPNIIWQLVNGIPFFGHMAALNRYQLVNVDRMTFLVEQLIMPGIGSFVMIPGMVYLLFATRLKKYRELGFVAISVVVILMLMRGKSYYTIGIYPLWMAAGGVMFENLLKYRFLRIAFPVVLVLLSWRSVPLGMPTMNPEKLAVFMKDFTETYGLDNFLRHENGRYYDLPQDYADMIGWRELAEGAAKAYNVVEDKSRCIVYAENYGQAGALTVYRKDLGLPEVISFSGSFYYWFPRQIPEGTNTLIYINDEVGEDVMHLFESVERIGGITDPYAREYGTNVYLCTQPRRKVTEFWEQLMPRINTPFR